MASLSQFAAQTIGGSKFKNLSLGQGQGNKAKELILQGLKNGDWICLQNCHLAISWMETLEKLQENQDEGIINPYYRLWLTSLPSDDFSINVL
jgi:dynein heavy chain